MKAIRIHEFGGSEVMKLEEVERPAYQADELLIKVYASSVNPADYIIRQGGNDLLRPFLKLPLGLGLDAAGVVEAVGDEVQDFKPGDKVYGVPNFPGDGAYAEYIAAKATQFALIPKNITFNQAGALPSCALIAWNGIIDLGKVQAVIGCSSMAQRAALVIWLCCLPKPRALMLSARLHPTISIF